MTLAAAFRSQYYAPGGGSAPGRVNLIGEHRLQRRPGPAGRPVKRTYAAAAPATTPACAWRRCGPGVVEMALADIGPGRIEGWAACVLGVAWALREAGLPVGVADIPADGQVGTGRGAVQLGGHRCGRAALSDLYDLGLLADDDAQAQAGRALARRAGRTGCRRADGPRMDQAA